MIEGLSKGVSPTKKSVDISLREARVRGKGEGETIYPCDIWGIRVLEKGGGIK